jgi:methyl-accepting chemotaxis protein
MDTVTQQNASLVEEAAAAAQSMQDQATNLTQVVSVFKLNGTHAAAVSIAQPPRMKPELPKATLLAKQPKAGRIAAANAPRLKKIGNATTDSDWEQF